MSKIQKLFQISTELVNATTTTTVLNPIPELAAAAAAEVMIALASGFLGIDDSKSWSMPSSSSCRDWVITIGGGDIYSGFERGMGNAA